MNYLTIQILAILLSTMQNPAISTEVKLKIVNDTLATVSKTVFPTTTPATTTPYIASYRNGRLLNPPPARQSTDIQFLVK